MNGASAKPIAAVAPKAPKYAPRKSGGASPATADCEVGTQSISPITNSKRISITTGRESFTDKSRNGKPISGRPTASLVAGGTDATRSVSRSWKKVTSAGLTIRRKPHVEFEYPCEETSEIGRIVSNAT